MEPDSTHFADVDAHSERETAWRLSLLLGSFVAALAAAFVAVGPVVPASGVAPGFLGHAGDATSLFTVCSVFVAAALLAQWPLDDRLRRLPIPLALFALARAVSMALVAGTVVAVIASVAGLWPSAPQFFAAGCVVGAWVGAVGALIGAAMERSRVVRIVALALVLLALAAGIVAFFLLRTL
jgi:hypothetical protein